MNDYKLLLQQLQLGEAIGPCDNFSIEIYRELLMREMQFGYPHDILNKHNR